MQITNHRKSFAFLVMYNVALLVDFEKKSPPTCFDKENWDMSPMKKQSAFQVMGKYLVRTS